MHRIDVAKDEDARGLGVVTEVEIRPQDVAIAIAPGKPADCRPHRGHVALG